MTNGQIAQLQDLSKCSCLPPNIKAAIDFDLKYPDSFVMSKKAKLRFRRLTHLYRHQIAAIKRNRNGM